MDTGCGSMAPITEGRADEFESRGVNGIFRVGQVVEVNGSRFRVQSLNGKRMALKILPRKKSTAELPE